MKEDYDMKIKKLKEELTELNYKNQSNTTHVEAHSMRNPNIEISKPIFYGNQKDQHPIEFLQNLEEYFKIKQVSKEKRIIVIRDCLRSVANNWYTRQSNFKLEVTPNSEMPLLMNSGQEKYKFRRGVAVSTYQMFQIIQHTGNTSHYGHPDYVTYKYHNYQKRKSLKILQIIIQDISEQYWYPYQKNQFLTQ